MRRTGRMDTKCRHLFKNASTSYQRTPARRDVGIPPAIIPRLCERGRLVRLARGLYHLADTEEIDAAHSFAAAARLAPHGIIALQYHGLTTQLPYAVWIGLHHEARIPRTLPFRLEAVRASGEAFAAARATACASARRPLPISQLSAGFGSGLCLWGFFTGRRY